MKSVLFICLCLGLARVDAQAVSLSQKEIGRLKKMLSEASVKDRYDSLLWIADAALADDPHPIDTIRTEGLLQGNPRKTATQQALRDMPKMYALALVYRVGGEKKYRSEEHTSELQSQS